MKTLAKILISSVVLVMMLVPVMALSEGMPLPLTKKLPPGTSTVQYAGQELRVTSPVALVLRLSPLSEVSFEMSVYAYGSGGPQVVADQVTTAIVLIDWDNWGQQVYSGPPPPQNDPFEGIFHSESGFTEK